MHLNPTSTTTTLSAILDISNFQDGKEKEHHDFDAMEKQIAEEKEHHDFDAMKKKIAEETVLHDTVEA
eukprot:2401292-Ditylum_brightwellii.AAC.1